jgi:hypothetical protein
LDSYPQYKTHAYYKDKVPCISLIQRNKISSKKNDAKSYSRAISILFHPWLTVAEIEKSNESTREATLNLLYFNMLKLDKSIKDIIKISIFYMSVKILEISKC